MPLTQKNKSKIISGHETPVMPASQRISLETNVIPDTFEKPSHQKHPHHNHHRHHNGMGAHETFLMCPGRKPIKIGSNQPVSINIIFENFVNRNNINNNGDNGEIYLRIKEREEIDENNNNNYNNHHANNHINAYHNELMNDENTSKATEKFSDKNNKGEDRIKNNLIKNNNHGHNNNNNCDEEAKDDGNVKHFINIYHRIVHSMADETATSANDGVRLGKPKIVVRSSRRNF